MRCRCTNLMGMAPASSVTFGPRRPPVWVARIVGSGACLFGAAMLALGILTAHQSAFFLVFFGLIGAGSGAYGIWMLLQGLYISRLRASLTPETLELTAHAGRHLWFQHGLATARLPWAEVQGFTTMATPNLNARSGLQNTYILCTKQGDFTLSDIQWENLAALMREISARTGRAPGEVAEQRAATKAQIESGKRRVYSFQRMLGWTVVIACVPLALLALIAGIVAGFSVGLVRALSMLTIAASLGASLVRYYRK